LGKSITRGVQSHVRNIIEHLIKLEHSPATQPREDWRDSIESARAEIEALLEESPSLKPRVADIIRSETPRAAKVAIAKLKSRHELDASLERMFRTKSYLDLFSYTSEQILGDWFPPEPKT